MNVRSLIWASRAVVFGVFCLIFVGGLVTSWNAGMAVPDWPLSFGGFNPAGWWSNWAVRLEHGHRLLAGCVALAVALLCSAVWHNWRAMLFAVTATVLATVGGRLWGVEKSVMAHLGIWPAALVFTVTLLLKKSPGEPMFSGPGRRDGGVGRLERGLSLTAFVLVCMQATLGGLRVTRETAGFIDLAQTLRIVHGCVAQAFLMTLVALSVRLSLAGGRVEPSGFNLRSLAGSAWVAVGALYCQLILGAAMRHLGVGLAIPSFPEADPSGSWIPQAQDGYTLLNFSHTRMGALLVAALVVVAIFRTLRGAPGVAYAKPLALTAGLTLVGQITLGILVVLNQKPPTLTTFHVFLGAALLACLTALAVSLDDRLSSPKGEYL